MSRKSADGVSYIAWLLATFVIIYRYINSLKYPEPAAIISFSGADLMTLCSVILAI